MTRRQEIQLYKYEKRQHYKQEKRKIYRQFHVGELDLKVKEFDKKWTVKLTSLSF